MKRKRSRKRKKEVQKILSSRVFKEDPIFSPLPSPKLGDWQFEYAENEQSYQSYRRTAPSIHEKRPYVYLVAIVDENVTQENELGKQFDFSSLMNKFREYLLTFFDVGNSKISDVKILPKIELFEKKNYRENCFFVEVPSRNKKRTSEKKIRYRTALDHSMRQLKVDDLLKIIKYFIPTDAYDLIALTMYDLFDIQTTLFVAGMASNNIGCFSLARYDPNYLYKKIDCEYETPLQFLSDMKKMDVEGRRQIILRKGMKTCSHEILHNFGLGHCVRSKCLMNGSGNLKEDERAPYFLCTLCLKKFYSFSFFDPNKRYMKMSKFFKEIKLDDEVVWIEKRLEFIKRESVVGEKKVIVISDSSDEEPVLKALNQQKLPPSPVEGKKIKGNSKRKREEECSVGEPESKRKKTYDDDNLKESVESFTKSTTIEDLFNMIDNGYFRDPRE